MIPRSDTVYQTYERKASQAVFAEQLPFHRQSELDGLRRLIAKECSHTPTLLSCSSERQS